LSERTNAAAKTTEAKKDNSVSQQRKTEPPQPMRSPADRIKFLQRTIGNQRLQGLLRSGALQAKLKISTPGDRYEQEADRVAERVVASKPMQAPHEGKAQVQRKTLSDGTGASAPDGFIKNLGYGQTLDSATRSFFEPRLGHDFSQVRIHTDAGAAESAEVSGASAYTVGSNIVFGPGQYQPESYTGRKLLSHELIHVIQQKTSGHMMQFALKQTTSAYAGNPQVTQIPGLSIGVGVVLILKKTPHGIDFQGSDYHLITKPSGGMTNEETQNLQHILLQAQREIHGSPIYSGILDIQLQTSKVEFTIQLPLEYIRTKSLQAHLVTRMREAIMQALYEKSVEEQYAKVPIPASKVNVLRLRIRKVRDDIARGYKEEGKALEASATRITALSISPEIRWNTPEWYITTAEKALEKNDLETATQFVDLSEKAGKGNEQLLDKYNAQYTFGDQVVAPVIWRASELLSLGLVDEKLFSEARSTADTTGELSKEQKFFWGPVSSPVLEKTNIGRVVATVGVILLKRVLNIFTFGGFEESYEKAIEAWKNNPDDPILAAIAAGGEGFARGLAETLLPFREFATLAGEPNPETGQASTSGQKWEAFFSALLKVLTLGKMAHNNTQSSATSGKKTSSSRALVGEVLPPEVNPPSKSLPSGKIPPRGGITDVAPNPQGVYEPVEPASTKPFAKPGKSAGLSREPTQLTPMRARPREEEIKGPRNMMHRDTGNREPPKPGNQRLKATGTEDAPALEVIKVQMAAGTEPQSIISGPVAMAGPSEKGGVQVASPPPMQTNITQSVEAQTGTGKETKQGQSSKPSPVSSDEKTVLSKPSDYELGVSQVDETIGLEKGQNEPYPQSLPSYGGEYLPIKPVAKKTIGPKSKGAVPKTLEPVPAPQPKKISKSKTKLGEAAENIVTQKPVEDTIPISKYEELDISGLRQRAKDPEAANALWTRYHKMSDADLRLLARRGDGMATSFLNSRIPPNKPLSKLQAGHGRLSNPAVHDQLINDIAAERDKGGIPRTGRTPVAPEQSVKGGTMGAARTDVPSLDKKSFVGRSPKAGGKRNPGSEFAPQTDPSKLPQTHGHAEQDIVDQLQTKLHGMKPEELRGRRVWMLIEQEPCSTCAQGIANTTELPGVIRKFSQAFPELTIEVKNVNTSAIIRIRGGMLVN